MNVFFVYMLQCSDGSYYVGHTDDLENRMAQHHVGALGGYTQKRRPVRLVWSNEFSSRDEAFAAERQIKGWSRKKKEALTRDDWAAIHEAARCRSVRLRGLHERAHSAHPERSDGRASVDPSTEPVAGAESKGLAKQQGEATKALAGPAVLRLRERKERAHSAQDEWRNGATALRLRSADGPSDQTDGGNGLSSLRVSGGDTPEYPIQERR